MKDAIVTAAAGEILSIFRTYAAGIGQDDEGPFMTMVFVYDSPQKAISDVDVFKRQIEEGFSVWTEKRWWDMVDSVEVWADGRSLRARLRGDIASMWRDIVYFQDVLVWCGE